jgi:hypothetical protein
MMMSHSFVPTTIPEMFGPAFSPDYPPIAEALDHIASMAQ